MKSTHYNYILFITCLAALILLGCKKEVRNITANTGLGVAYPLEGNQHILGSCKAPDGGYLVWGYVNGAPIIGQDGFVMRVDKTNQLLWYKKLGGVSADEIKSAAFDKDGNILAGGNSYSYGASIDTNSTDYNASIYTVYLSGNGQAIWEKTYTAPGKNYGTKLSKVLFLSNGSFALVGSTNNFKHLFFGSSSLTNHYRAYIQCINSKGDTLWNGNYHFLYDTITTLDKKYVNYASYGINALETTDHHILLLMAKSNWLRSVVTYSWVVNDTKNIDLSSTLLKIPIDNKSGENNYSWKITIPDLGSSDKDEEINKYPINPFLLADAENEIYQIGTNFEPSIFSIDKNGNLLNKKPNGLMSTEERIDMAVLNGNTYSLSLNNFTIITNSGVTLLNTKIMQDNIMTESSGIYLENNGNLSMFCSYLNARNEIDIAKLCLNNNGEIKTRHE